MVLRERYDLILLDLKMPRVNAIDLLARLRQIAAPGENAPCWWSRRRTTYLRALETVQTPSTPAAIPRDARTL